MFLVDGTHVLATDRRPLVDGLLHMARAYGSPSIVVFDGKPTEDLPNGAVRGGVKVLYQAHHPTAGDRIVDLVERESHRFAITVVTSSEQLAARVRSRGARVAPAALLRRALGFVRSTAPFPGRGAWRSVATFGGPPACRIPRPAHAHADAAGPLTGSPSACIAS